MITGRTRIAGVMGAPVTHSLSPLLMNSWIKAAGIEAAYLPFPARDNLSINALRALGQTGLIGLNVTLPFKTLAAKSADIRSSGVQATGAANLILFKNDKVEAHNTDIEGVLYAFSQAGQSLENKSVLVLGAGGVARAVCAAVRQGKASRLIITNRTRARADELALMFEADAFDWYDRQSLVNDVDVIINATNLGLDGQSSPEIDWTNCKKETVVFDTVYTPSRRPFTDSAKTSGITVIDGLSMLIGQARPSFEALFGTPVPDLVDAQALLRKELGQ